MASAVRGSFLLATSSVEVRLWVRRFRCCLGLRCLPTRTTRCVCPCRDLQAFGVGAVPAGALPDVDPGHQ